MQPFRCNLLSRALLLLGVSTCLMNVTSASASNQLSHELNETPKPQSVQNIRRKRSPTTEQATAEKELEKLIIREQEDSIKNLLKHNIQPKKGSTCLVSDKRIEWVLEQVAEKFETFQNGFRVKNCMFLKRYRVLTCQPEVLSILYDGQEKFSRATTIGGRCIRSYIERSLSEYLEFCIGLGQQAIVEQAKQKMGMKERPEGAALKSTTESNMLDSTFVEPSLSKLMSLNHDRTCSLQPDEMRILFEFVDDPHNTWVAGYRVDFLLRLAKPRLWHCDEPTLKTYQLANKHYNNDAVIEGKQCITTFFEHYLDSLYNLCSQIMKRPNLRFELAKHYVDVQDEKRKDLERVLPESDKSRSVVEKFVAGGKDEDFLKGKYEDILKDCKRKYFGSMKALFGSSSIQSLQAHCNNVIEKLDSIKIRDFYGWSLNFDDLKTMVKAHKICKYLIQTRGQQDESKTNNKNSL